MPFFALKKLGERAKIILIMTVFRTMIVTAMLGFEPALSREVEPVFLEWGESRWIGFTTDNRPDEWAAREVRFNQPPADISSWKPTAAELSPILRKSHPAPLLRKEFDVHKPVESARVVLCGLGLFELHLNGERVGDRVLDPAQTSYEKHAFYVEHDITTQLEVGPNAIGLMLGNGFYGQNIAFAPSLQYGAPRGRVVVEINYEDGSSDRVESSEDWQAQIGPVLFDNIYMGETYDARQLESGWSMAGFSSEGWQSAELMEVPTETLLPHTMEPMRKVRKVEPIEILPGENSWIIDMGENMTGWLEIAVSEPADTIIEMRFAEHLMPDRQNIDTASTGIHATGGEQRDIYICRGDEREVWEPRFTYHGFRYVQMTGLTSKPKLSDLTGWLIRTDVERIGSFECSDPLINKFYEVSMRTIEGNLQGLLSDCPHRERCAWMGDIHATGEAASLNYDLRKFWRKTSRDIESTLGKGGTDPRAPTNISVGNRLCGQARPDWGAATVLVPWFAYLHYGDLELVDEAWPLMTGWMEFLNETVREDGLIHEGYGDWCPPGSNRVMDTPTVLTSSALYYQSLTAMQAMAKALARHQEEAKYEQRARTLKDAFNNRFLHTAEIPVKSPRQTVDIVIEKAIYGANEGLMDLTERLKNLVSSSSYQFQLTNAFAGKDPAPLKQKALKLDYSINGERVSKEFPENSLVSFLMTSIASYGSQTGSALALHSGLVPEGKEQLVADGLAAQIMDVANGHYTTGILGHRPLYTQLNNYGHSRVTRHLWQITDWPSLGFMTEKHGLTVWPEVPYDWDITRRYLRNSFNHPMHSGFAASFHESIGGIRPDPSNPGYRNVILKPCFLPDLKWAKSSHQSPQGLIASHWERQGAVVTWEITIPEGSSARVEIPQFKSDQITLEGGAVDGSSFDLRAGVWNLRLIEEES
jgi:alpha-L-rhamnosidase